MLDLSYIDNRVSYIEKRKKDIIGVLSKFGINIKESDKKNDKSIIRFQLEIDDLKQLKVACIMDRFTLDSYIPECNIYQLTPSNWKNEIENFKPHMLFIESAWQGKDGLWFRKIANGSKEYFEMTSYCQENNIPIIFWNKEDPGYNDIFMTPARMADFIFTTDIDCIKKYKDIVKHDNVYHLHFAAQPQIHNPIENYKRKDKFCFAGAYYHKYVQRCNVFDDFSEFFINTKGFDIYDRNYKCARPEHKFPNKYDKYIIGKLDPSEIDLAYKGYYYGINMNSAIQSQTMFARRLFEMLASNTVTIGNYSRGVKNYFGDLTVCTDDSETLKQNISKWFEDETSFRKYRLQGLRKVLSEHLYEDRLSYIVEKVFNKNIKRQLPLINAFAEVESQSDAEKILELFNKQKYNNKKLYLICNFEINNLSDDIIVLNSVESQNKLSFLIQNSNEFITLFNKNNYYGENYLLDIALSTRYGEFNGLGKANYYKYTSNVSIEDISDTYKLINTLKLDRAIIKATVLLDKNINELIKVQEISFDNLLCTDEFSFCENFSGGKCLEVDDIYIPDKGIILRDIEKAAENIKNDNVLNLGTTIHYDELLNNIKIPIKIPVAASKVGNTIKFNSNLKEDINYYVNIERLFNVNDYIQNDHINLIFNGIGSTDLFGACIFYDKNQKKISPVFTKFNVLYSAQVPKDSMYFKLALRFRGKGEYKINEIIIGATQNPEEKSCFISRSNVLVLTNNYPSSEELYRNMFVHKRMMSYKEEGNIYDIMRMNIYAKSQYREFEGINVVEGQANTLANILQNGNIDTICVHFLDKNMWEVLKCFKDKIRIIVWCHGADIQPWWRRKFNYKSKDDIEKAKKESDARMSFWKEIFSDINNLNIHFVFVSEYFANEVFEDYKVQIPIEKYSIIHNLIDTKLFKYKPKNEEERLRILTIKPFSSSKYGNDLTTKAILELSKNKIFDKLQIDIYGDGDNFDNDNKPLRKFKNISLNKTFLNQNKICELHRNHGIFIATTRWDSQGVSRDEAMSSGMVIITNNVAAIPEFVDENCGIIVPEENYMDVANSIIKLFNEPDYFLKLSQNAATRVRSQSIKEFTINKEIKLIEKSGV
ncbi:glycosyltransferase [Clostridium sp. ZBS4]|uniref:glycosyltransferase n=1 Tax=Clostridium sp. ZBS4 TaxID=2949974 RepID=UPI00207947C7|nr:glycosyltransferase [Clostridium sp. ZBS4]